MNPSRLPTKGKAMTAGTPIRSGPGSLNGGRTRTGTTEPPAATRRAGRTAPMPALNGAAPPARSGEPALRPVDELSEVRAVARGTVQAAMEVLAGIRPVHQLARRLDGRCLAALQHRASLIRHEIIRTGNPGLERLHRNSVVRSVRVCAVADGTYEASAVVVDEVRARAVALRLERSKQVWRVTELEIG